MLFLVIAQEPDEFDQWLARQAAPAVEPSSPSARAGAEAFVRVGCSSCHAVRGTVAEGERGPDLTHFASRRTLGAGILPNERGQLAGWIANAQGPKPGALMPPSTLTSEELLAIVDYLESLE